MNTPAHLLLGAAAFGGKDKPRVMIAATAGALMPDLSLYLMAGTALFVMDIPASVVFRELYYSDAWQRVFAIDNALVLWGAVLVLALLVKSRVAAAFAGAGMLHLLLDFPLHAGDGRAHFWPLTSWVYDSPVSYWDVRHHAGWVAPVVVVLCLVSYAALWRRAPALGARAGFGLLLLAEIWVSGFWALIFSRF